MSCKGCGGTAAAATARLTAPPPEGEDQFIVDYPNGNVGRHGWDEAQSAVRDYGAVIRNDPGMRSLAPDDESNGAAVSDVEPAEPTTEVEPETEEVSEVEVPEVVDNVSTSPDASTEGDDR